MSEENEDGIDPKGLPNSWIRVGDYILWPVNADNTKFGITCMRTGESGVFKKEDFLPYVSSFFGLNF